MKSGQTEMIPDTAEEIYSNKESYRQYVANLDLTINWYNKVVKSVLEVEFPLIEGQLQDIDSQLKEAEETLNWKDEGESQGILFLNWVILFSLSVIFFVVYHKEPL